jgi:hypothetical protein
MNYADARNSETKSLIDASVYTDFERSSIDPGDLHSCFRSSVSPSSSSAAHTAQARSLEDSTSHEMDVICTYENYETN